MALTTDIRIFPQKEMFAVDMAEILDTAITYSGVIQGCDVTFNSDAGTLSIESGRILIRGRLCIITETGDLAAPEVSGTANVTCYLVASCNLSTSEPFSVEIIIPATYEEYVQRKEDSAATFNTQDGFDFVILGTAIVNPSSGKITSWTPNSNSDVKKIMTNNGSNSGGNRLPAETNIDNLTKIDSGWWYYNRSIMSGTFPVADTYGIIGHIQGASSNSAMQIIRSSSQVNNSRIVYARFKADGAWAPWQRFVSANSTRLTITDNSSYYMHVDLSECSAYKKGGFLFFRCFIRLQNEFPAATEHQVATISGWNAIAATYDLVNSREYRNESLGISVSRDGRVTLRNYTSFSVTVNSTFMCTITVPAADGAE